MNQSPNNLPPLEVSTELWRELSVENQQKLRASRTLTIRPSYAPAPDLDMPIELAMVARYA